MVQTEDFLEEAPVPVREPTPQQPCSTKTRKRETIMEDIRSKRNLHAHFYSQRYEMYKNMPQAAQQNFPAITPTSPSHHQNNVKDLNGLIQKVQALKQRRTAKSSVRHKEQMAVFKMNPDTLIFLGSDKRRKHVLSSERSTHQVEEGTEGVYMQALYPFTFKRTRSSKRGTTILREKALCPQK